MRRVEGTGNTAVVEEEEGNSPLPSEAQDAESDVGAEAEVESEEEEEEFAPDEPDDAVEPPEEEEEEPEEDAGKKRKVSSIPLLRYVLRV